MTVHTVDNPMADPDPRAWETNTVCPHCGGGLDECPHCYYRVCTDCNPYGCPNCGYTGGCCGE